MATLRIHFSAEDLARTRVTAGVDLLWELVLSVTVLRGPHVPQRFREWRQAAGARLGSARRPERIGPVVDLVPPVGDFPDFLTPPRPAGSRGDHLAAALEQVAATARLRLHKDLTAVFAHRPPPAWVQDLAVGRSGPMRTLTAALRVYYDRAIALHRGQITAAVHADRTLRARHVLDGGIERLLAALPEPIRWHHPVLHSPYPHDRDIHLRGRGITLIPSFFCHGRPVVLIDTELPPVLVYPAAGATAGRGMRASGHPLHRPWAVAAETGQQASLRGVKAFIDGNLGDPRLTPGEIAAAHHISLRQLYRLFTAENSTVAEWIRARRLERCRRELTDPAMADRTIAAVAARWGFTSDAHFSRLFRTTYGLSPGAYRWAHVTPPGREA